MGVSDVKFQIEGFKGKILAKFGQINRSLFLFSCIINLFQTYKKVKKKKTVYDKNVKSYENISFES